MEVFLCRFGENERARKRIFRPGVRKNFIANAYSVPTYLWCTISCDCQEMCVFERVGKSYKGNIKTCMCVEKKILAAGGSRKNELAEILILRV